MNKAVDIIGIVSFTVMGIGIALFDYRVAMIVCGAILFTGIVLKVMYDQHSENRP